MKNSRVPWSPNAAYASESAASGPEHVSTASASTVTVHEATHGVPATIRSQRSSIGSMRPLWKREVRLVVHAVQALDDGLLELVDHLGALAADGIDPVDALVVDLHLELLRPAAVAAQPGADRRSFGTLHRSHSMLRRVRYLAPALALLVLAGCGEQGPTPEEQVRSTVAEFGRATAAKDYRALCDRMLAPELVEEVESIGLPCEVALCARGWATSRDPRLTIGRVEVRDDEASAEVRTSAAGEEPSQDTLELVNLDGAWKISSLGT